MPSYDLDQALHQAAAWLADADSLLITAGAGMGVDSGLPDFRGNAGLWNHYPALGAQQIPFSLIANPFAFLEDPHLAWGFYGHRLSLYRDTIPHPGFTQLLELGARLQHGAFVVTSNVDGQFQKAGFPEERLLENHGSIHHLQCLEPCQPEVWSAAGWRPEVASAQCRLVSDLPRCPHCGQLARPNILMFDDMLWLHQRTREQTRRWEAWRASVNRLVVLEIGAGSAIPSMRLFGSYQDSPLIRLNLREPEVTGHHQVGIALGAAEGIRRLLALLG